MQLQNEISGGILKLQSDKIPRDNVDVKLELEEL
jgi:hypothetical protein